MRTPQRVAVLTLLICVLPALSFASAYNARPKLVVIIVIDQFRGDYLERYRDQFGDGGFRLLLDHGAYFPDCNYDYANTRTAPGHATLLTGAYSDGHGIIANELWSPQKQKMLGVVHDDNTHLVGMAGNTAGVSPRNLMADTLDDQLKLATAGQSRVFSISLKDYAAVVPAGYAADGAYWVDHNSGDWITSSYYRSDLPQWVQDFNAGKRWQKYLNQQWKDNHGNILRTIAPPAGVPPNFYQVIGPTPFADDYELGFARELLLYEKLGTGPATDLLLISLSANDILGHKVGPDSPEMHAMALALDRQLADFFNFLGHQIGLANVWIALSADHGVAPLPAVASKLHIPAAGLNSSRLRAQLNQLLVNKLSPGRAAEYVGDFDYPLAWLNESAFSALRMKEADAEHAVGEAIKQIGLRAYFTKSQLAGDAVPETALGLQYAHSYSPEGGWYVLGVPAPFFVGIVSGTDHGTPYNYDTHVPLALYGLPFQAGTYRSHSEPIDLAATLASLLGINAPTHAVGRVLTEALAPERHAENSSNPRPSSTQPYVPAQVKPAALGAAGGSR